MKVSGGDFSRAGSIAKTRTIDLTAAEVALMAVGDFPRAGSAIMTRTIEFASAGVKQAAPAREPRHRPRPCLLPLLPPLFESGFAIAIGRTGVRWMGSWWEGVWFKERTAIISSHGYLSSDPLLARGCSEGLGMRRSATPPSYLQISCYSLLLFKFSCWYVAEN